MTDNIQENNTANEQTENTDVQQSIDNAHTEAKTHFSRQQRKPLTSQTYNEVRADAKQAANIAQNLHDTIASSTPPTPVGETMQNDNANAAQASSAINNGTDPLAAYAGYSAYAVPQQQTDEQQHRNYDEYSVSEDKKGLNVSYNLTELAPGGAAPLTQNPNFIIGGSTSEQSYSYNERKSGNKTIVTTEHSLKGTNAPGSEHIHIGNTQTSSFQNTQNATLIYDKDMRLTEQTYRSESNNVITDSHSQAYKGQDMSGAEKGYFHTMTEVSAVRNDWTRFSQTELTRDGQQKSSLSGQLSAHAETYAYQQGDTLREASHHQNDKGEWIYEGSINTLNGDDIARQQNLSPALAEKEFNRLKGKCNHALHDLTGANSLEDYTARLGSPKPQLSLSAVWNNNSTEQDRKEAEQANTELNNRYANKPAAIVATNRNTSER